MITINNFKNAYPQWLNVIYDPHEHHGDSDALSAEKQEIISSRLVDDNATIANDLDIDIQVVIDHKNFISAIQSAIDMGVDELEVEIGETIDWDNLKKGVWNYVLLFAKYKFFTSVNPADDHWKSALATNYREAKEAIRKRREMNFDASGKRRVSRAKFGFKERRF